MSLKHFDTYRDRSDFDKLANTLSGSVVMRLKERSLIVIK